MENVDAVIVGAGFSGLYLLHRLRKAGFSTRVFERGGGVGGTWYWNRYPGARCDVESLQYSYSFDEQLQQEWHWPEKFSAQPDILAYANHVADRFDLKKDIEFNTEVKVGCFDEKSSSWKITTSKGEKVTARFFIMATGCISTTQVPSIKGLNNYKGNTYHTGNWPHEEVNFAGQNIAVIGTGSSGIQSIPVLAEQANNLTVFQRTPNYSIPSQNEPMTNKYEQSWKDVYTARRKEMRYSAHGSLKDLNNVPALSVDEEQRQQLYSERWAIGGTGFLGSFNDLLTNADANYTAAEFVRQQIKKIVEDQETAEILCPTTYPIGTKRICIDTGYFETYNRKNVKLIDISKRPIQRLVSNGIVANEQLYVFDSIIFATGFDAMTGSLFNVDIKGRKGIALRDKWNAGPKTYLGLMSASFPNLFMITGPGSPSVKSNMIMSIEQHVDLVTDTLLRMRREGLSVVEPELAAENSWVEHVQEVANKTLFPRANSWYMGANIPGKPRALLSYLGGLENYRQQTVAGEVGGYNKLKIRRSSSTKTVE